MDQVVTLQLDTALVAPLLEDLASRADAWLEIARVLEADHLDHGWENAAANAAHAQRMADLYTRLIGQIKNSSPGQ